MQPDRIRTYAALARFAVAEPSEQDGQQPAEEFNALLDDVSRQIGRDLHEYLIGEKDLYQLARGGYAIKPGRLSLHARQTLNVLNMMTREGRARSLISSS